MIAPISRFLKRFHADAQGGVLILFGIASIVLILTIGIGVDTGLRQIGQVRLQTATDAAGIAAATLNPAEHQVTDQDRINAAQRYFKLNYVDTPSYPRPEATVSNTNGQIRVKADASTPSFFNASGLGNWGESKAPAETAVGIASATSQKYDMILVLDYSSSMVIEGRIDALNSAASALIDRMLQGAGGDVNKVALIKWSDDVFDKVPLTNNATLLKRHLDSQLDDGTNSTAGLEAAVAELATIDPARKEESIQVVVLLTDGKNNAMKGGGATVTLWQNNDSLKQCKIIKKSGALLYTVLLGKDWDNPWAHCQDEEIIKSFLSTCATNGRIGWERNTSITAPQNYCQPHHDPFPLAGPDDYPWQIPFGPDRCRSEEGRNKVNGELGDWCCLNAGGGSNCYTVWFAQADMANKGGPDRPGYYYEAPNSADLAGVFDAIASIRRTRIVPPN